MTTRFDAKRNFVYLTKPKIQMSQQRVPYETFSFRSDAEALQELLLKNGIICVLDFPEGFYDNSWFPTLDKNRTVKYYQLMLNPADFTRADQLQFDHFEKQHDGLDSDYPLNHFTDLELFDVLEKFEQWSKFDYSMARRILDQRGLPVDEETLKTLKDKRINKLAKPNRATMKQLTIGYVLVLFLWLGLLRGAALLWYKYVPDGRLVREYDNWSRRHGWVMIVLGAISMSFWFIGLTKLQ